MIAVVIHVCFEQHFQQHLLEVLSLSHFWGTLINVCLPLPRTGTNNKYENMYTKQKPWLQIFNSTCWTSLPAPFASWSLGKSSHKTLALCLLCKYESYKCVCITLLFTLASGFFGVRSPENFHTLGNVCMVCTSAVSRQKAQQNWVPRTHFLLELFSSRSIFFNQAFLRVRYSLHSWRFWRKIVLREDTFIQSYPKQSLSMEVPTMKDKMR